MALQALCVDTRVLGLANLMPWQDRVYLAIGYTVQDFLDARNDRQAFLYFSNDDSFEGIIDLPNHRSISGEYYYLYSEVPLNDRSFYLEHLRDQTPEGFASHMLTTNHVQSIPDFERGRVFIG